MDYYGLFPKFKFNRSLNVDEKNHQLKVEQRVDLNGQSMVPDLKLISFDSQFLELVDKYYSSKGMLGFIGGVGGAMLSLLVLSIMYSIFFDYGWANIWFAFPYLLFLIPCVGMAVFMFVLLKTECFAWTHYPIRFDRKNRLVHYFRLDGTAHSVPWDKVFFTSGLSHRKDFNKDYYISGHILAEDNQTVIDTFCLPATNSDRQQLERHWEFVRRYMEEGPESVAQVVNFCLPIAGKREGYQFGLLYLLSGFNGAPMFLLPLLFALSFIISIPRYIAMITSKVPVWPQSIESQCAPLEDDPYAVDASNNPEHPWRDLFSKAPKK